MVGIRALQALTKSPVTIQEPSSDFPISASFIVGNYFWSDAKKRDQLK